MSTDTASGVPSDRYATLDPRTRRALAERMSVAARGPGIYRVESQSDTAYIVDLPSQMDETSDRSSATCTCPDYETNTQENNCKHIRRVKLDIAFGELPAPEETSTEVIHSDHEPAPSEATSRSEAASVATDGGEVKSADGAGDDSGAGGASADTPSSPGIENASSEPVTRNGVYHQIAERIREIEAEVDRHRAELRDLETALAVLEEYSEEVGADSRE